MLSIIACISQTNRAIGYQNRLLYHIKSDLTRFRELTTGHAIIMGRKTYESLPNGALPHRRNIVVSRSMKEMEGCEVYPNLEAALKAAESPQEIFIIGGESIYRQSLHVARKLYLTVVDDTTVNDAARCYPAASRCLLSGNQSRRMGTDRKRNEERKRIIVLIPHLFKKVTSIFARKPTRPERAEAPSPGHRPG